MSHFPLLLSLAHFGSHLPPRRPDLRGSPSGKVGTIPRAVGCACAVCDPDDEPGGDDLDGGYPARSPK